jgi:hypothetical protein
MRLVGYKRFYESCKELSQEEILLRQKVYNLYSGPGIHTPYILPSHRTAVVLAMDTIDDIDCFYWPSGVKVDGITTWFGKGTIIVRSSETRI